MTRDTVIKKMENYIKNENAKTPDKYRLNYEDLEKLYDYFINGKKTKHLLFEEDFEPLFGGIDGINEVDLIETVTSGEIVLKYKNKSGFDRIVYMYL